VNPSLYDLLDVDSDASDAEIRAAWKASIADLDPSDRRFRAYNQAAEVLLDPGKRAAYDAELEAAEPEPELVPGESTASAPQLTHRELTREQGRIERARAKEQARARRQAEKAARVEQTPSRPSPTARWLVPIWLLIGLAVVVAALIAGVVYVASQPSDTEVEEATQEAQSAAERAIVPVLSYDAKTLDEDQAAAHAQMTSDYRKEYDKLFESIKENAPRTGTVVTAEEPFASGIVRSGEDRVEVLLFVNRPTTNKARPQPVVFRDQVTVTMQRVGEDWLIDDLKTSPVAP
jgi:Mce-associated membrane protein